MVSHDQRCAACCQVLGRGMLTRPPRLISLVCDQIWQLEDHTVKIWKGDLDAYKRYLHSQNAHG